MRSWGAGRRAPFDGAENDRVRTVALALAAGLAIAALPSPARAQLSSSNLLLAQSGNLLYTTPRDRTDLYDELDLAWRSDVFAAGGRLELDRSSDDRASIGRLAAYDRITQRWAEWEGEGARVRVGNFYTILGRGLLHRSFELPGVVYDEAGTRTRYAAARDVDGAIVHVDRGPIAAQAFAGHPNDATVSPASEVFGIERYKGVLQGGQLEARGPRTLRAGAAWTRFTYDDAPAHEGGTGFVGVDPLALAGLTTVSAPFYAEYAQQDGSFTNWWELRRGHETPHALYSSLQLLWGVFSLSGEWKDYDQFRLGVNDPPSLVREHAAPLLNRTTHLLDADGEAGFQLEGSARASAWATLTVNFSRSDGAPGIRWLRFEERYAEARIARPASDTWDATIFSDRGFDTFDFVTDRHVMGALATRRLPRAFAIGLDAERSRFVRTPFLGRSSGIEDQAWTLTASRAGWGSAGVTLTRTNDPIDLPSDALGNPTRSHETFVGGTLSGNAGSIHAWSLFVGRRRGGRACTSGTCYDVPSLDGAELRVTSRY